MFLGPGQRTHRHPVITTHLDHGRGRNTECIDDHLDRMVEGHAQQFHRFLGPEGRRRIVTFARMGSGGFNPVRFQQVIDKILVALRNTLRERFGGEILFMTNGQIFWDQDINAVRLAVHMRIDPRQFNFKLFRIKGRRAEHAKPTCLGHRRHNIAAVAKGKKREIDPQSFAKFVGHQLLLPTSYGLAMRGPKGHHRGTGEKGQA